MDKSYTQEKKNFKYFLINLAKDTERLGNINSQLVSMNIEYTRVPAVSGKEYSPTIFEYDSTLLKKPLMPNEIGCAISHRRIYEQVVGLGIDYAIILEDDILLPKVFENIIKKSILDNERTKSWEYLSFNYRYGFSFLSLWLYSFRKSFTGNKSAVAKILILVKSLLKFLYIFPLTTLEEMRNQIYKLTNVSGPVTFYRPLYLAGCYIVSLEGAKKLLSLSSPIKYTADRLPNQARIKNDLLFKAYAPMVVDQQLYKYGSSILELSGEDHKKIFGSVFKL